MENTTHNYTEFSAICFVLKLHEKCDACSCKVSLIILNNVCSSITEI